MLIKTAWVPLIGGSFFAGAVLMGGDHGPELDPRSFQGELIASSTSSSGKGFTIQGFVVDLYPGAQKSLTLQFSNPNTVEIRVTDVSVVVSSTSKAGCPTTDVVPTNFSVKTGKEGVAVPKNGTSTMSLPIRMVQTSNNACSGARFFLSYSGTAVQG